MEMEVRMGGGALDGIGRRRRAGAAVAYCVLPALRIGQAGVVFEEAGYMRGLATARAAM